MSCRQGKNSINATILPIADRKDIASITGQVWRPCASAKVYLEGPSRVAGHLRTDEQIVDLLTCIRSDLSLHGRGIIFRPLDMDN